MTVQEIINGITEYMPNDGGADYITTREGLMTTGDIAGAIIGILVTIIIVGLPIVIAVEVCYINFPIVQCGYDNLYHRLKGKASRVFGLVIRDARKSLEESHTTKYGTSVNWIYFKRKVTTVFLSVFIVAMVLGPGEVLLSLAFKLVQGIFEAI